MAVGRPRLKYLKQVARNTGADSYTAMKKMGCNNSRWKTANQSKGWRIRRGSSINWLKLSVAVRAVGLIVVF